MHMDKRHDCCNVC